MVKRDGPKNIIARRLYQTPVDFSNRWFFVLDGTFTLIPSSRIAGERAFGQVNNYGVAMLSFCSFLGEMIDHSGESQWQTYLEVLKREERRYRKPCFSM